jgi:site-specific DNA-adenine methylase
MNKLEIAKKALTITVGLGVSKISATIIKNNVQPENLFQQVTVGAGAVVIGMMASDASKTYTNTKVDELVAAWSDAKKNINEAKKESK